ncbi:MAG: J domain-containing protein [Planctomycetaceae bacterium]|nr:J domain-containing protein [Planctomycetaceae bacterium]
MYAYGLRTAIVVSITAFSVLAIVYDYLVDKRSLSGFWQRYKADYVLMFSIIAGIVMGIQLFQSSTGVVLGVLAGLVFSFWLNGVLGWSELDTMNDQSDRLCCLATLQAIARVDSKPTPKEMQKLHESARDLLEVIGLNSSEDVKTWLRDAANLAFKPVHIRDFIFRLPHEWKLIVLLHALRITYCSNPISPQKKDLLFAIYEWCGINDESILALYDRGVAVSPQSRRAWFDELGLHTTADQQQIQTAYREIAKKYHPDRLGDLPPDIMQLASAKLTAATAAYRGLTNREGRAKKLGFRAELEETTVYPEENERFTCRCWLCEKKNRIPAEADNNTARCGYCHALLGLPEDSET